MKKFTVYLRDTGSGKVLFTVEGEKIEVNAVFTTIGGHRFHNNEVRAIIDVTEKDKD